MSEIIETSEGKSDGINNLKFCARKAELKFAIFGLSVLCILMIFFEKKNNIAKIKR